MTQLVSIQSDVRVKQNQQLSFCRVLPWISEYLLKTGCYTGLSELSCVQ